MITTSHAVINAYASRRPALAERFHPRDRILFVIGGVAPDVALYLLFAAASIYYPLVDDMSIVEAHQKAMDDLFFNSPWWIASHNVLHAPIVLVAMIGICWLRGSLWARRVAVFAAGAMLHSLIDIAVHHDDGPLLLFPFSWSIRFESPVSYWDPDHFGWFMRPIDLAITVAGVVWFVRHRRSLRRERFVDGVSV